MRSFEWPTKTAGKKKLWHVSDYICMTGLAPTYDRGIPKSKPYLKHIFNITISTFYLLGVFKLYSGWLQLMGSAIVTYTLAKYKSNAVWMPWTVFG